jgi:hypothetical protein
MTQANSPSSRIVRALVLASLFVLTLVGHGRANAQSSTSALPSFAGGRPGIGASCDTSWSAPRELLTKDGLRIYVEGPSVVGTPRGLVLVGSPTIGWMSRSNIIDTMVPVRPIDPGNTVGVSIDPSGAAVPLPRLKWSSRPITLLALNDRGALQILWATRTDTLAASNLDSIWTSTLHGDTWDRPRSLVQGQHIRWYPNFMTWTDIAGEPLTIVPMDDTTRSPGGGLLLLRRVGKEWQRRWIGTGGAPPIGSSVIATSRGSIVAAFTGELTTGGDTSSNAVVVMKLRWSDSSRIGTRVLRRVGRLSAVEPKLFMLGRTLHLVWIERENGHPGGRTLYESTSIDDGATWSEPTPTVLSGEHRGLSIVVARETRAFAALQNLEGKGVSVLSRHADGWRVERHFSGAFTPPRLMLVDGALRLMYAAAAESPEVRGMAPFTMVATRPLQCEVR